MTSGTVARRLASLVSDAQDHSSVSMVASYCNQFQALLRKRKTFFKVRDRSEENQAVDQTLYGTALQASSLTSHLAGESGAPGPPTPGRWLAQCTFVIVGASDDLFKRVAFRCWFISILVETPGFQFSRQPLLYKLAIGNLWMFSSVSRWKSLIVVEAELQSPVVSTF